jgi:hypothetical protein
MKNISSCLWVTGSVGVFFKAMRCTSGNENIIGVLLFWPGHDLRAPTRVVAVPKKRPEHSSVALYMLSTSQLCRILVLVIAFDVIHQHGHQVQILRPPSGFQK